MIDVAYNATLLFEEKRARFIIHYELYNGETPNLAFNVSMIAIWGVILGCQIIQIIYKQYWFSIAFICTGILEILGYIGRTWSHSDTTLMDPFLLNMICLTIAPVFTMGGIYYQLAKLLEIYGPKFGLWKPIIYSYVFIACDIISLAIQAAGGGTAGMAVADAKSTLSGTHIFVAGLAIQVFSMLVFILLWFHFLYQIYIKTRIEHAKKNKFSWSLLKTSQQEIDYLYRQKYSHMRIPSRISFHYFNLALTTAVLTIFTRCVYRLAELSEGWSGNLISHEWYFISLDAIMMTIACVVLTIFHPGFAFQGRTQSVPIAKTHRSMKKTNRDSMNLDDADLELSPSESTSAERSSDSNDKSDTGFKIPIVDDDNEKGSSKATSKFQQFKSWLKKK